jgi:MFS family permease
MRGHLDFGTGVFGMMLNTYVPNAFRRYAIAGLVMAIVTPLAAIASEVLAGASMAHAGYVFLTSPFGMAAIAAPLGMVLLVAGLGYRHDRLARQIRSDGRRRSSCVRRPITMG